MSTALKIAIFNSIGPLLVESMVDETPELCKHPPWALVRGANGHAEWTKCNACQQRVHFRQRTKEEIEERSRDRHISEAEKRTKANKTKQENVMAKMMKHELTMVKREAEEAVQDPFTPATRPRPKYAAAKSRGSASSSSMREPPTENAGSSESWAAVAAQSAARASSASRTTNGELAAILQEMKNMMAQEREDRKQQISQVMEYVQRK